VDGGYVVTEVICRHVRNFYPLENNPAAEFARVKTRAALIWTLVIVIGILILARICTC
jgi:hypothetical protein